MTDYIYNNDGHAQGFRLNSHIFDMDGKPVGRVCAEKAYRLSGEYVGAVVNNMIVDRPDLSKRRLPPREPPADVAVPLETGHRRPIGETAPDLFHLLTAP